jgi:hypothetical protein
MQSGLRLSIDCGTAATVAVLAWPDGRWTPLLFDVTTALPSAVHVGATGEITAGVSAWQRAAGEPAGLVLEPLRAAPGSVQVGETDVTAQDLVAATLRYVAAEAVSVAGTPVPDVRMVVPAGWGPRRRTWLRSAAYQAGLGQPRLVEAPVAAADRLLATGAQVPVGAFILVCDAGAGFEATVLRRGPAGFEVLSTLADPAAGGTKIDELFAATVHGARGLPSAPVSWPAAVSLRAAKEALSQQPTVTVLLPPPAGPTVVSSAVLEDIARPVVKRAGELAAEAVRAAELIPEQLAGMYCIGAGAAAPMLPRSLTEQLGVAPTVLPDPGFAAVLGAAEAGGRGTPAASVPDPVPPEPPVRRALALAVPGVASLALYAQFLLTASFNNGSRQWHPGPFYYVIANWGELATACILAAITCMAAGSLFGAGLARTARNGRGRPAPLSPAAQLGTGMLAAAAAGLAIAALYAAFTSVFFGVNIGAPMRWSLYPVLPAAVIGSVVAVVAARQLRTPVQGWDSYLALPVSAIAAAAVGVATLQYCLITPAPSGTLWIDVGIRIGGLLIGVAVACALAEAWPVRLLLALLLAAFTAAVVSWQSTGLLAVMFAAAVGLWWCRRLWELIRNPARTADHA